MPQSGKYILAIDQGTTGTTVLIIDDEGSVAGRAYSEFTQIYPQPGWVEHDPEEIWTSQLDVAVEAEPDSVVCHTRVCHFTSCLAHSHPAD